MGAIQDIFRQYAPGYVEKFGAGIPANHLNAIEAIVDCRSGAYGFTVYGGLRTFRENEIRKSGSEGALDNCAVFPRTPTMQTRFRVAFRRSRRQCATV